MKNFINYKGDIWGLYKKNKRRDKDMQYTARYTRRLMIVTEGESMASLIHDTSPILRHSLYSPAGLLVTHIMK